MPWWFWIVLWVVLVVVCALFLAFLGVRIFRQSMAVLKDIEEAGQLLALPERTPYQGGDQQTAAVFLDPAEVRSRNRSKTDLRVRARSQRRVKRRTDRGQPQLLRDMPHL